MFTGLVEALGTVRSLEPDGSGGAVFVIDESCIAPQLTLGESVAVNGVCLTVVEHTDTSFRFQVGPETLQRTNLGRLRPGDRVNLERSLRMGDRLGGHFVQGHVDAIGTIAERYPSGEWDTVWFACDPSILPLLVPKGSIAVDGVSLTVVDLTHDRFSVMLIPHTLDVTTLGLKRVGDSVNLETDMLARHVARLLSAYQSNRGKPLSNG